jgi:hypothetical protein
MFAKFHPDTMPQLQSQNTSLSRREFLQKLIIGIGAFTFFGSLYQFFTPSKPISKTAHTGYGSSPYGV